MSSYQTDNSSSLKTKMQIWNILEQNRMKRRLQRLEEKKEEEARKLARIKAKLESGEELTQAEMQFLKVHAPQLYALALRIQRKREQVEEECLHARSKEEVNDIYFMQTSSVAKEDPARKCILEAIANVMKKFKDSSQYKELPDTAGEGRKKKSGVSGNPFDDKKEISYETTLGGYQETFMEKMVKAFEATS